MTGIRRKAMERTKDWSRGAESRKEWKKGSAVGSGEASKASAGMKLKTRVSDRVSGYMRWKHTRTRRRRPWWA